MRTMINRRRAAQSGSPATNYLMTAASNPEVFPICVAQGWCSVDGMTYEDAANISNIGVVFKGNTDIVNFNELKFFGISTIANYAFNNCTNLENIDLPDTVTKVSIECFQNCAKLKTPNFIPNITEFISNSFNGTAIAKLNLLNAKKLYVNAFYNCKQLTEVTIGENITDIAGQVFLNCPNIQYIRIMATTPPTLGSYAVSGSYPIYVPDASVNDYKTAWSGVASRIYPLSEFVEPQAS